MTGQDKSARALRERGVVTFCGHCEAPIYTDDTNAKASEICGYGVCLECAPDVFSDNGQFGVGA